MDSLFVQYLGIYNNENLHNRIFICKVCSKIGQILNKPLKSGQRLKNVYKKMEKFRQIWSYCLKVMVVKIPLRSGFGPFKNVPCLWIKQIKMLVYLSVLLQLSVDNDKTS